jgi:hypothetical protein
VADDPGKIMAALKHPHINRTANILYDLNIKTKTTINFQPHHRSNNSETILNNLQSKTTNQPTSPPSKLQPTSMRQKEAPNRHDKAKRKRI